jgi:hypothetical protein
VISSSRGETAHGDEQARNPDTQRHQPSPIERDMLNLPSSHNISVHARLVSEFATRQFARMPSTIRGKLFLT